MYSTMVILFTYAYDTELIGSIGASQGVCMGAWCLHGISRSEKYSKASIGSPSEPSVHRTLLPTALGSHAPSWTMLVKLAKAVAWLPSTGLEDIRSPFDELYLQSTYILR